MIILTKIAEGLLILAEIFIACLPVYIVLFFLDKLGEHLTSKIMRIDIQAWIDAKMEASRVSDQLKKNSSDKE